MQPSVDHLKARVELRKKNRLDPVYWFLDRLVFESLFRPRKRHDKNVYEILTKADIDFLIENLQKHRIIIWCNLVLVAYLATKGLSAILNAHDQGTVVTGLLAPAMITGGAWYAVSFGGIPEKFIKTALWLTAFLFLSFSLSMTLLIALLCAITPWPVGAFILIPSYVALYVASLLYDNLDGLKIGLDTTLLKYSRATLNYFQKYGLVTGRDTEREVYANTIRNIPLITHHLDMLERNLSKLRDRDQGLEVANDLIANSIEMLFKIIDLSIGDGEVQVDRGEEQKYQRFLTEAINLPQEEVDDLASEYLRYAIAALSGVLGPVAASELKSMEAKMGAFSETKTKWKAEDDVLKKEQRTLDDQHLRARQQRADHEFAQLFLQIHSLISAYRHVLFEEQSKG